MGLRRRQIREQQRNHRITFRSGGENGMGYYGILAAPQSRLPIRLTIP
jgi:hypothetical protein